MFVQFRNAFLNYISESESHSVVSDPLQPCGLYSPWNSPGQNTEVGSLSLLQGVFPTQESNQGLLHCKEILYQLSHQGSPSISVYITNLAYLTNLVRVIIFLWFCCSVISDCFRPHGL